MREREKERECEGEFFGQVPLHLARMSYISPPVRAERFSSGVSWCGNYVESNREGEGLNWGGAIPMRLVTHKSMQHVLKCNLQPTTKF